MNACIASATVNDGAATDAPQGPVRTVAEKARLLLDANRELNALADECGATEYTPRADDETTQVSTLHLGIEQPRQPMTRRPSSGYQTDYVRSVEAVVAEHISAAEKAAVAAWRGQ